MRTGKYRTGFEFRVVLRMFRVPIFTANVVVCSQKKTDEYCGAESERELWEVGDGFAVGSGVQVADESDVVV